MGIKSRPSPAPEPHEPDPSDPDSMGPRLTRVDSIHGHLMVLSSEQAREWKGYERGTSPAMMPIVEGRVAHYAGALVLLRAQWARLDAGTDGSILVTAGDGPDDEAVLERVRALSDDEFATDEVLVDASGGGFAAFDGSASWQMVSGGLFIDIDAPAPRYRLHHCALDERTLALRLTPE